DVQALDEAIRHEGRAALAWEELVKAAGDVYADDPRMGRRAAGLCGHWKDELAELKKGLAKLREQRERFRPAATGDGPGVAHVRVRRGDPGKDLVIRATVAGQTPVRARVTYRNRRGEERTAPMKQAGPFLYEAVIPGAAVGPGLSYSLEGEDGAGRRAR